MNDSEVCALCPQHMKVYQQHIKECTCAVGECDKYGSNLTTKGGSKRFCSEHARKLIMSGPDTLAEGAKSPPLSRGHTSKKQDNSVKTEDPERDPDMPHLEPMPRENEKGRWPNPSESVSTGSTNSNFDRKLKEIGGRFPPNTPNQSEDNPTEAKVLSRAPKKSPSVRSHSISRRDSRSQASTVRIKRNKKSEKTHSGSSDSGSISSVSKRSHSPRSSSSSSPTNSVSDKTSSSESSSSSVDRKKHRRKKEKRGRDRSRKMPSFQSLLPKGLCHAKVRSSRHTVRGRDDLGSRLKPRGKYEAIVDHLSAAGDRKEKEAGGFQKLTSSRSLPCVVLACAKPYLGRALMVPISKIVSEDKERAKGIASGTKNENGDYQPCGTCGCEWAFRLPSGRRWRRRECDSRRLFPNGQRQIQRICLGREQIGTKRKGTTHLGLLSGRCETTDEIFAILYGEEHKHERLVAIKYLKKFHGEKPELYTVSYAVEAWNRLWFEYGEAVRGGIRSLMRIPPEGASREALVSLALSPYGKSGKRVWRWPDVFSFTSRRGMWLGRLLPETEEKLELSRIGGVGFGRTGGSVNNLLQQGAPDVVQKPSTRTVTKEDKKKKKKRKVLKGNTRTGANAKGDSAFSTPAPTPVDPTPTGGNGDTYPKGKRLRAAEYEASKQHTS